VSSPLFTCSRHRRRVELRDGQGSRIYHAKGGGPCDSQLFDYTQVADRDHTLRLLIDAEARRAADLHLHTE
jgi:hypothetical protein